MSKKINLTLFVLELTRSSYFSCIREPNDIHSVFLRGGAYPNFSVLPGAAGPVTFNDLTSSLQCGPIGTDDGDDTN